MLRWTLPVFSALCFSNAARAAVHEFTIPDGLGSRPWNTPETTFRMQVGDLWRVTNLDASADHTLHTGGDPCPHGGSAVYDADGVRLYDGENFASIPIGGYLECVLERAFENEDDGVYDHFQYDGRGGRIYLSVTEPEASPVGETEATRPALSPVAGQSLSFAAGGTVPSDADQDLARLAAWVETMAETTTVMVDGFYCQDDVLPNSETDELLALAEQRAKRLKSLLVDLGLESQQVTTIAYGMAADAAGCRATATPAHFSAAPIFGIGAVIGSQSGTVVIQGILGDSPAERGGALHPGDRIVAIKTSEDAVWRRTEDCATLEEVVGLIRGVEGSVVELRIERPDHSSETIALTRAPLIGRH